MVFLSYSFLELKDVWLFCQISHLNNIYLRLSSGFPLQSWVFTKGQGKGALTPTPPSEGPESTVIEVEDIPALLRDVARFAEAVEKLKDVVLAEGKHEDRLFLKFAYRLPPSVQHQNNVSCLSCEPS